MGAQRVQAEEERQNQEPTGELIDQDTICDDAAPEDITQENIKSDSPTDSTTDNRTYAEQLIERRLLQRRAARTADYSSSHKRPGSASILSIDSDAADETLPSAIATAHTANSAACDLEKIPPLLLLAEHASPEAACAAIAEPRAAVDAIAVKQLPEGKRHVLLEDQFCSV